MNTLVLNESFSVTGEDRAAPEPGPGEMVIRVRYCGICRTDRKAYRTGQRDLKLPRVLGHEFSGTIHSVGEGLQKDLIGKKASVHPGVFCGSCPECLSGNDQLCAGMKILGFHLDGGFSRYVLIPSQGVGTGIVRILDDDADLRYAAMAEPLGCALHMADSLPLESISSVLITGGGVMGMMMAKLMSSQNKKLIITEPIAGKRDVLRNMGFTAVSPDGLEESMKKTGIASFDCAVNCSPRSSAMKQCLGNVKNGGQLGFFSGLTDFEMMDMKTLNEIHYKELTVRGTYGCGSRDTLKALHLMKEGFDLSDIPVRMIRLGECEDVLRCEETEDSIMTMIDMEER